MAYLHILERLFALLEGCALSALILNVQRVPQTHWVFPPLYLYVDVHLCFHISAPKKVCWPENGTFLCTFKLWHIRNVNVKANRKSVKSALCTSVKNSYEGFFFFSVTLNSLCACNVEVLCEGVPHERASRRYKSLWRKSNINTGVVLSALSDSICLIWLCDMMNRPRGAPPSRQMNYLALIATCMSALYADDAPAVWRR